MEDMDNNEKVDVVSSMEEKANNDEGQMVNAALTKEEIINQNFQSLLISHQFYGILIITGHRSGVCRR